jgi:hypothetical protein
MNLPAPELELERPRAAAMKFTYPSGSRPLEGYTIKRGVGRGGFGEVYFATSDAGKEVAIKLIRRNLEVELRGVTQCLNLKHPNLIALYDIRTDEMGDQWVIMEYVSGESLEDVIERHPNGLPIDQALWWMRGMCAGVAYLHDHGIVHRDLKPGNIFSDEGTVKIGDYGLAKFISCSRRSGQTESVGTVHYMAPEIANGRYGREIDTYALGIILFEMLTGRVPFEGESVGEVLMKHLTAEPDLSALAEPYQDIVRRALAKDPNGRIDSVAEMVALLPAGGEAVVLTPVAAQAPQPKSTPGQFSPFENVNSARTTARENVKQAGMWSPPGAEAAIEEPLWKAIRNGIDYVRRRWHGDGVAPLSSRQKVLLVLAMVGTAFWLFDQGVGLGLQALVVYGIYYMVWVAFIRPGLRRHASDAAAATRGMNGNGATRPADQQTAAWPLTSAAMAPATRLQPVQTRRRHMRPGWRERANQELAAKSTRNKTSELLGSMLLSSVFAAIAAAVAPLLMGQQPASDSMAVYLWLVTVGTLGSWAVLIPAKFAEGKLEDQVPMRLTLLLCGALVGAVAWVMGDTLLLHSPGWGEPVDVGHGLLSHETLGWPATGEGMNPSLPVYIAYFAFLFLLPRWWRQTEFTRDRRMSLWWITVCVGWAWLLHIFWWFPQPTGMLAAGVIAMATQLASPWMPPSRRRALSVEVEGGAVQP